MENYVWFLLFRLFYFGLLEDVEQKLTQRCSAFFIDYIDLIAHEMVIVHGKKSMDAWMVFELCFRLSVQEKEAAEGNLC